MPDLIGHLFVIRRLDRRISFPVFPAEPVGLRLFGQQNVRPAAPHRLFCLQHQATAFPRNLPTAPDGAGKRPQAPAHPPHRLPRDYLCPGSGRRGAGLPSRNLLFAIWLARQCAAGAIVRHVVVRPGGLRPSSSMTVGRGCHSVPFCYALQFAKCPQNHPYLLDQL